MVWWRWIAQVRRRCLTKAFRRQVVTSWIDGDRGKGRERGGDVEGDEEKVHNILPKKVTRCHG